MLLDYKYTSQFTVDNDEKRESTTAMFMERTPKLKSAENVSYLTLLWCNYNRKDRADRKIIITGTIIETNLEEEPS